jgi:acetyl-CoA carboxylase alpha subunit
VPEPPGGAQNDPAASAAMLDEKLAWHLSELQAMPVEERIARRLAKFREIARFYKNA